MKSRILLFLCLVSVLSFSGGRKAQIVGYWEVFKTVNTENDYTETERKVYIEFENNGVFKTGRIGPQKKVKRIGKWKYKGRKNAIKLVVPKSNGDNGDYKILQLTKDRLIFRLAPMTIYMDKGRI